MLPTGAYLVVVEATGVSGKVYIGMVLRLGLRGKRTEEDLNKGSR